MNSRRDFLQKAAAASTILASGSLMTVACGNAQDEKKEAAPGMSNETFTWSIATTWPPNFPVLGEGVVRFAKNVERMSSGRLKIKVYGAGERIPALELFDAVSNGAIEMGHGAPYYWAGKMPACQFFAAIPFGMNAQQMKAWIKNGGGLELWQDLYAKFGVVPFLGGNTGVQMGGWFNKEINTIDDLRGIKMRIPGLGGKVLTKAGGSAVTVAGGEIYTNLERGVIDATEWIGPYHDYNMGFHKIAKYYYYPGWHEPGTMLEFIVNKAKFDALPDDLKAIVEAATAEADTWMFGEFEVKNNRYLQKLVEEEGVQLKRFPEAVMRRLRELSEEVYQEVTAADPDSQKVYAAYTEFRQQAVAWSKITEIPFYEQIQA
ncbi:MAG: TRAP transporter substrate-binding protein [Bernardetiaceae bacterium]